MQSTLVVQFFFISEIVTGAYHILYGKKLLQGVIQLIEQDIPLIYLVEKQIFQYIMVFCSERKRKSYFLQRVLQGRFMEILWPVWQKRSAPIMTVNISARHALCSEQ